MYSNQVDLSAMFSTN